MFFLSFFREPEDSGFHERVSRLGAIRGYSREPVLFQLCQAEARRLRESEGIDPKERFSVPHVPFVNALLLKG